MVVWKFVLRHGLHIASIPAGAEIVYAGIDTKSPNPAVWALVDAEQPVEQRSFLLLGTGHAIPPGSKHVGSFHQPPFVWHLFEGIG